MGGRFQHLRGLGAGLGLLATLTACGWRQSWEAQSQLYVDGELVATAPVHSQAYRSYLLARIALEATPPNYVVARVELREAIGHDANDPHLWTTLAEVDAALGDMDAARGHVAQALKLAPDFPPARALARRLDSLAEGQG